MFKDRKDAGKRLAKALTKYKNGNTIILAIPRGGVEVGFEVAKHLGVNFNLLISRKLPLPYNPESGFGAISEDGSTFIFKEADMWLSAGEIERIKAEQSEEIKSRIQNLRGGEPLPDISDKKVVLVDDGLAMGSTIRASIMYCKNQEAFKIIVAVPVAGTRVVKEISKLVDDIVVLEQPTDFRAVAQVYENWHDVSDEEVLNILKEWKSHLKKNETI